jgi:hypothetical protein
MPRDRRAVGDLQLGFAWYTRETWAQLCQLADDRDALDDTFEEWERQAINVVRELASAGRRIRKITIDVDAAVTWCRQHGRRFDSAARSEYVAQLLRGAAEDRQEPAPRGS